MTDKRDAAIALDAPESGDAKRARPLTADERINELVKELAEARKLREIGLAKVTKDVKAVCASAAATMLQAMIYGELCQGQTTLTANELSVKVQEQVFETQYSSLHEFLSVRTLCAYEITFGSAERMCITIVRISDNATRFEIRYKAVGVGEFGLAHDYGPEVIRGVTCMPNQHVLHYAYNKNYQLAAALLNVPRVHQLFVRAAVAVLWCNYYTDLRDLCPDDELTFSIAHATPPPSSPHVVIAPCDKFLEVAASKKSQHAAECHDCVRYTAHFNQATYFVMATDMRERAGRQDLGVLSHLARKCVSSRLPYPAPLVRSDGTYDPDPESTLGAVDAYYLIGDLIKYMPGYRIVMPAVTAQ